MLNQALVAYITDSEPTEGTEHHYDSVSNQDITVTWSPLPDGSLACVIVNPMKALAASLNTFSKIVDNINEETSFSSDYRIRILASRDTRVPPTYDKCWHVDVTMAPHREPEKEVKDPPFVEKKKASKK